MTDRAFEPADPTMLAQPNVPAQREDVDTLFPTSAQEHPRGEDVDTLFPQAVETRRQEAAQGHYHGPVADLLFGDTTVNPAARILSAFGEGFQEGWGESPVGLSKETSDYLKKIGMFNDYEKGQRDIIKAGNEVLMRKAAIGLDVALSRYPAAAFRGAQATVAQIGTELGVPKLGRELAAMPEAFPTEIPGLHAPIEAAREAGVIGKGEAGWKGLAEAPVSLKEAVKPRVPEIEPETISGAPEKPGAFTPPQPLPEGEAKPAVVTPNLHETVRDNNPELFNHYDQLIEQKQALQSWLAEARAEGTDAPAAREHLAQVDRHLAEIEPQVTDAYKGAAAEGGTETIAPQGQFRTMAEMLAAQGAENIRPQPPAGEATAAPQGKPLAQQREDIAADATRQYLGAGEPPERAQVLGNLTAERYVQIAQRFNGAIGSAEDIYRREGPTIRGATGAATPEPAATPPVAPVGEAAEAPIPAAQKRARGPAAMPEQNRSLLQFISGRGGIRNDDALINDLRGSIGKDNQFVPGFGPLIRPYKQVSTAGRAAGRYETMGIDRAREAAVEAGYLPEDATVNDFLEAVDRELRGERQYRSGMQPEQQLDPDEQEHLRREAETAREDFIRELDESVRHDGGELTEQERARALEMTEHEGIHDLDVIKERLFLESGDTAIDSGATNGAEPAAIPGWDDAYHGGTQTEGGVVPAVPGPEGAAGGGIGGIGGEGAREEAEYFQRRPNEA